MGRPPLFNLFEYPASPHLYRALRSAGPARAWQIMHELAALDEPEYFESVAGEVDDLEIATARTASFMRLVPALANRDIDGLAREFAHYGPKLQLETTFITMWLADESTLFSDIIDVEGAHNLTAARASGSGVLVLPMHLGPSYVIAPLLSHLVPVVCVFNRLNFHEMKEYAFPDLDITGFQLEDESAFRRGIAALRADKAFVMFPEFDPRGIDEHHVRVPFLGTTVMAPSGPVLMSRVAQAPIVTTTLESTGGGRFLLTIHEPIDPPSSVEGVSTTMRELWRRIEGFVADGSTAEWEMWFEFDRMLPQRKPDLG